MTLASLRGLRTAPELDEPARAELRSELRQALSRCSWFTLGVMAPDRASALACLRQLEGSLGWSPLQEESQPDPASPAGGEAEGPVFLKGNQRSGCFRLRQESGLGVGLLISGHDAEDPAAEDTWGPLPLDLFA